MVLAETVYVNRQPVGVIRHDITNGQIAFSPTQTPSKLKPRNWNSIDHLKKAVIAAYTNREGPPNERT